MALGYYEEIPRFLASNATVWRLIVPTPSLSLYYTLELVLYFYQNLQFSEWKVKSAVE